MTIFRTLVACTLSGALTASQTGPAAAAPLPTNVAIMTSMVADRPTQVHWHGGWGLRVGAIAGAIIGGAIANSAYGYYGAPYYSGYPYGYYHPRAAYYGYGPHYGYGYGYGYGGYRPYYGYHRHYGAYGYYGHHYRHHHYW